jgi:D-lactate dehydrogenase (cytochrome)
MGLDVVLPTGELISAGVRTRKGVVGYDLARLIVGSEGTLGVITKLVLKLLAAPASVATIAAVFDKLPEALQAVTTLLTSGHVPSAVEFLDRRCLSLVSDLLPFPGISGAGAFLLVETDGNPEVVAREVDAMTRICRDGGAKDVLSAPEGDVRERIWGVRREISKRIEERHASLDVHEDIAVPIARIAEFAGGLPALEERCGMMIYTFGHAGDGNLHLNITAEGTPEPGRIEEGIHAVLERVLAMGGTISGEHGIGLLKKPFIGMEISPASLRLQRGIKRLFDPRGILNPGKIFPD